MKDKKLRDWKKYIQKNRTEGDCQLVTVVNAYYYLTGKTITDKHYERLIDLCGCRYGGAVAIEKVLKKLGLIIKNEYTSLYDFHYDKKQGFYVPLPLEVFVWHKSVGYHSCLIVEYEINTRSYRVINFKQVTNMRGWVFEEDFQHYVKAGNQLDNCSKKYWNYRLFNLKS